MRKTLPYVVSAMLIFSASGIGFADNFDAAAIAQIHTQVKNNMTKSCMTSIPHATQTMCDCIGDKLQSNIDDTALSKCAKDSSGRDCVMQVAKDASAKTITPEVMKQCMPQPAPKPPTT